MRLKSHLLSRQILGVILAVALVTGSLGMLDAISAHVGSSSVTMGTVIQTEPIQLRQVSGPDRGPLNSYHDEMRLINRKHPAVRFDEFHSPVAIRGHPDRRMRPYAIRRDALGRLWPQPPIYRARAARRHKTVGH